ncbi:hypothetical protein B0H13DRAFT_2429570 [Mycena leptocephala]|nr:hypothetical protein B0H13DRAFT_2429570 [Mycena leptocephala]
MIVPGIIAFFTAIQLGAGIWTAVIIAQVHKFSLLEYRLAQAWLAATAVTDLVIVGGTIYYLLKARQPGFHKSTDDVLSHIIKVPFATGTMCALFAILDLALYIKYDGTLHDADPTPPPMTRARARARAQAARYDRARARSRAQPRSRQRPRPRRRSPQASAHLFARTRLRTPAPPHLSARRKRE